MGNCFSYADSFGVLALLLACITVILICIIAVVGTVGLIFGYDNLTDTATSYIYPLGKIAVALYIFNYMVVPFLNVLTDQYPCHSYRYFKSINKAIN